MFKKKIRKSFRRKIAEGKKNSGSQPDGGVATVNIRAKREMDVAACAMGSKYRNLILSLSLKTLFYKRDWRAKMF
jgi:hypothetical protein